MPDTGKLIDSILGIQGGIHPALFLMVCLVAGYLFMQLRSTEKERREEARQWQILQETTFEKRLEEQRATLTALERNATTMASLGTSIEGRTMAINELVKGFAEMVHTQEGSRELFKAQAHRLEKGVEETLAILRGRPQ